MKTCRTCKQDFPLTLYRLGGSGKPRPDCNACDNKKRNERNRNQPSKPLPDKKKCTQCKKIFLITEFPKKGVGRVHSRCKTCESKAHKIIRDRYAARNPDDAPFVSEKICNECKKLLPASEFGIVMSNKDGLKPYCKPCESKRHNIWVDSDPKRIIKRIIDSKKWRNENPERMKATQKEWREKNIEKVRKYSLANRKKYMKLYPERDVATRRRLTLSGKNAAYSSKRRTQKLNATPPWLDMEDLYIVYELAQEKSKETGEIWEVDHIDPLQSKYVCGLHIFANLELVSRFDNRSKGNKFTPYRIDSDNIKWELKGEKWIKKES